MSKATQTDWSTDSPYPGISPFSYAHRDVFFAREAEVRKLARLIVLHRETLLYADSGTGKSSLINAGIIPAAMKEGLSPERIRVQPKRNEEIVVERTSEQAAGGAPFLPSVFARDEVSERIVLSVEAFLEAVRHKTGDVYPLLIFDQFEEWITLFEEEHPGQAASQTRDTQEKILDAIVSLLNDSELPIKFLFAFREDYLARLTPLFRRCPDLPDHYLRLIALSGDQIYRVIRGPFEPVEGEPSVAYDPQITEALAREIQRQFEERRKGGDVRLTEVQIVCHRLFEAGRQQHKMEDYFSEKGGVQGLLEGYLESTLKSLDETQQESAVALLRRMVTSAGTRHVISRDALLSRVELDEHIERAQLSQTLDALEQKTRLVRREQRRDVLYYEIASEFLVGWIQKKAAEYERLLEQRELEDARRAQERERWAKEQERTARRFRRLTCALALILLAAVVATLWACRERGKAQNEAKVAQKMAQQAMRARHLANMATQTAKGAQRAEKRQRQIAHAGQLAARAQLAMNERAVAQGVLLAVESLRVFPSTEAERALRDGLSLLPRRVQCLKHESGVNTAAFSSDGRHLATGSQDGTARVWNVTDGQEIRRLKYEGEVLSVAFSPDGKYLATGGEDNTARVSDWAEGKEVAKMSHKDWVRSVAFDPNGVHLATGSDDNTACVWDWAGGEEVAQMQHEDWVRSVAFSPDGVYLATGGDDNTVRVWNWKEKEQVVETQYQDSVLSLVFSPDGMLLASGTGTPFTRPSELEHDENVTGTTRLWNWAENREAGILRYKGSVSSVAFSPTGKHLATVSDPNTAEIWPLMGSASQPMRVSHEGEIVSIAFDPNGVLLATASCDNTARVWSVASGDFEPMKHEGSVSSVAFSPNGAHLAIGVGGDDGTARVWNVNDGEEVQRLKHNAEVFSVAFGPEGKYLATGADDNTARVWDWAGGEEVARMRHEDCVRSVAFDPNGMYLATGGEDNTARVWDWAKGEEVAQMRHEGWVLSIAFGPDGAHLATGGDDGTARVWSVTAGQEVRRLKHDGEVLSVAFSPDSRHLATGGDDNMARVWDWAGGEEVARMSHEDWVRSVAFDPSGTYLVTGGDDNTARVWDWAKGEEIAQIGHEDWVLSVAFGPGGVRLATGGDDGTARVSLLRRGPDLIIEAGHRLTRNLTYEEWSKFFPNEDYRKTFEGLPVHPSVVRAGRELARRGQIDDAVEILRRACDLAPDLDIKPQEETDRWAARGERERGEWLAKQAKVEEAVEAFREARRLDPNLDIDPKARARDLAFASMKERGESLAEVGRVEEAAAAFRGALELDPNWVINPEAEARRLGAQAMIQRGRFYARYEEMESAISAFRRARDLDPNLSIDLGAEAARGLVEKGERYIRYDQVEMAIDAFRKARELDPNLAINPEAKAYGLAAENARERGQELVQEGRVEEAVSLCSARAQKMALRGTRSDQEGRVQEARAAFAAATSMLDQGLRIDPNNAMMLPLSGQIYHEHLFDFETAYRQYDMTLKLAPADPNSQANFAEACLTSRRFTDAYHRASELVESSDSHALPPYIQLAMRFIVISSLVMQQRYEDAEKELPGFVEYHQSVADEYDLGWSYRGTRHFISQQAIDEKYKALLLELIDGLETRKLDITVGEVSVP